MIRTYPVFDHADWNQFGNGTAYVRVPQEPYADPRFPFEWKVGQKCIIVENEEMMGTFAIIEEIVLKPHEAIPRYVKVKVLGIKEFDE